MLNRVKRRYPYGLMKRLENNNVKEIYDWLKSYGCRIMVNVNASGKIVMYITQEKYNGPNLICVEGDYLVMDDSYKGVFNSYTWEAFNTVYINKGPDISGFGYYGVLESITINKGCAE